MNKVLTISIAAYNIAPYLKKLMDSIISMKNIDKVEVLLVNDGSKDETVQLTEIYCDKYPESIKLIDKPNGGHGSTINVGIEAATGKYFKALDGDDWIDTLGTDEFINKLEKCSADLVLTDYKNVYEEENREVVKTMSLTSNQVFSFIQVAKDLYGICYHNICFKTDLLKKNNIALTEHSFYVDNELIAYPIPYVNSVIYYTDIVYCYRLGRIGQSVSIASAQKNVEQHYKIVKNLLVFYRKHENLIELEKREFLADFISIVTSFQLLIRFSFKPDFNRIAETIMVDDTIKKDIKIYQSMKNKTFRVWRINRRLFYVPVYYWINKKRNGRSTIA